jgi:hypothetical protein
MPKHLTACPSRNARNEQQVRKLKRSAHAPAGWVVHAKMVAANWAGLRTRHIVVSQQRHPQTVRERCV